jgi:hypothetical protein
MRCRYGSLRSDSSSRCCGFIEPQASSRRFEQGGRRVKHRARAGRRRLRTVGYCRLGSGAGRQILRGSGYCRVTNRRCREPSRCCACTERCAVLQPMPLPCATRPASVHGGPGRRLDSGGAQGSGCSDCPVQRAVRGPTRPKRAPCGSRAWALNSPPGIGWGPSSSCPPPAVSVSTAASMSFTPM